MKKDNNPTIYWLWMVSSGDKWKIFWMAALQMALGGSSVLAAWLLRGIIDCAVSRDFDGFWGYSVSLVILTVAQLTMRAINRYLLESARSSLENRFKKRLFSVLLRKDYAAITAVHSGEWMNRLTSDTTVVADGLASILPELLGMAVKLIGALVLLLYLMPALACVILPGGLLLALLTYAFRKVLKRLHKRIQEADGRLRVFLTERLSAMLIVRTFGKSGQTIDEADAKMAAHRQARMRRNHFSNLCNIGFGVAMNGAYLLGAIYCGYGILTDTMSYGTFTAVLQLVGQVQSPFANITGYLPKYYAMLASAERLMEAEDYPEDFQEPELSEQETQEFYRTSFAAIGLEDAAFSYYSKNPDNQNTAANTPDSQSTTADTPDIMGPASTSADRVSAETSTTDYMSPKADNNPSTKPYRDHIEASTLRVITGLNLRIQKGEYVAFTGHSGCGKSTVLKLLMSLYPLDSGSRYIETDSAQISLTSDRNRHEANPTQISPAFDRDRREANPTRISPTFDRDRRETNPTRISLTSRYRSLFAFVPQGNQLLSGSIREIIAFGDTVAMHDEVRLRHALEVACADDFVYSLDMGLDTVLGERGTGLSEGQMQRIAIARAVFSNHPILLLDEATSSLDEATEARLLEHLRSMTDRTVIIVTHRPAALRICDRVISFTGNTTSSESDDQ